MNIHVYYQLVTKLSQNYVGPGSLYCGKHLKASRDLDFDPTMPNSKTEIFHFTY